MNWELTGDITNQETFAEGSKIRESHRLVDSYGGKNWKKLGKEDGIPEGELGRIGLTIAYNEPSRVYALIEASKNGLYKSDDGGFKWELVNSDKGEVTNRAFYFQDVRVDPKNENRLYNIKQTITVSEDAGKSFKTIIPYSGIHPDH